MVIFRQTNQRRKYFVFRILLTQCPGSQPPKQKNELLNQKLQNLIEQPRTNVGDQLKYTRRLLSL